MLKWKQDGKAYNKRASRLSTLSTTCSGPNWLRYNWDCFLHKATYECVYKDNCELDLPVRMNIWRYITICTAPLWIICKIPHMIITYSIHATIKFCVCREHSEKISPKTIILSMHGMKGKKWIEKRSYIFTNGDTLTEKTFCQKSYFVLDEVHAHTQTHTHTHTHTLYIYIYIYIDR